MNRAKRYNTGGGRKDVGKLVGLPKTDQEKDWKMLGFRERREKG